jgi:hypothetical protein
MSSKGLILSQVVAIREVFDDFIAKGVDNGSV